MEVSFNALRTQIQSNYNCVSRNIESIFELMEESGIDHSHLRFEMEKHILNLGSNIGTLMCIYGESEKIESLSHKLDIHQPIL